MILISRCRLHARFDSLTLRLIGVVAGLEGSREEVCRLFTGGGAVNGILRGLIVIGRPSKRERRLAAKSDIMRKRARLYMNGGAYTKTSVLERPDKEVGLVRATRTVKAI